MSQKLGLCRPVEGAWLSTHLAYKDPTSNTPHRRHTHTYFNMTNMILSINIENSRIQYSEYFCHMISNKAYIKLSNLPKTIVFSFKQVNYIKFTVFLETSSETRLLFEGRFFFLSEKKKKRQSNFTWKCPNYFWTMTELLKVHKQACQRQFICLILGNLTICTNTNSYTD